ncbi:MAG: glycosyltransferase [Faecalicatena sp.]|uniref:glycosyltransferase family 2 protein n=1 Tax=Faecalicatena sp. TaxID=2005360 RepID=UPI00258562B9|nr:glycosyltransferase family 2 protein [Faecalicatena sp.]MCI6465955.1 glycosyltransferase [Faecalicatena sp.]MDY5618628.1 glycosyltransferase family 2 protein [Lachnospiraceae bacterium]
MENDLISVIVPVYNAEKYLKQCIDSVIDQTYTKFELILVDDGSTDACGKICDYYAKLDKRIQVIHKKNGGLSDARNTGVENSNGNWIFFLDSDDYICSETLELLLEIAIQKNAQMVIGNEIKFFDNKKLKERNIATNVKVLSNQEAILAYFYRKIPGYACGKLINRELLDNVVFPVGKIFEDAFTVYRYINRAERIATTEKVIYYYRQRKDGIIRSSYSHKQLDIIEANVDAYNFFSDAPENIRKSIISKRFVSAIDVLRKMPLKRLYSKDRHKAIEEIINTRMDTLKDSKNSKVVRCMAFMTFFSPNLVGILAKLQRIIKLKRV